jgi:hypothetical protein
MSQDSSKMVPRFATYGEFWVHYLSQHQHPANRILHAAGTIGGATSLVLAGSRSLYWLLAVLPLGYGAAWLGHFLVERNRPLTFQYPFWSLLADYQLVILLLMGRLPHANASASDAKGTEDRRAA